MTRQLETYINVEVRWTICFLCKKLFTSTEIHCEISTVYGSHPMSRKVIVKCCQQFEDGRTDLTDAERKGRLTTASIYLTVSTWRPVIFTRLENSKNIWVEGNFPTMASCFKLAPGQRSDILSLRHRMIGRTFRQISAATERLCREIVCSMCVMLYCSLLLNQVFFVLHCSSVTYFLNTSSTLELVTKKWFC